ncbi:MAG TPA: TonB-dependent siderophore receptor [Caulobacteraceae bacterium]|jgi:iron complex outermembrane receptor protein|nr:TonB-dependent siderophore receptor [Caulobacteraceae bacterium]
MRHQIHARGLRRLLLGGAVFAAVAPMAAMAFAADPAATTVVAGAGAAAPTSEVSEVVVTARHYVPTDGNAASKTKTPLIETPSSVTVITRDQIDVLNLQTLQQTMRYTAGVTGENYGPDARYDWITVRGFYPIQYVDGLQSPAAPASNLNNMGLELYGFQAVEVLKGPASVLYGGSPPGGILNVTSRRPQDSFHAELRGQIGNYNEYEVGGFVTGPVADGVDLGLTAFYKDNDGQIDFEHSRRAFVAPAASFQLGADTRLTLLAYYQDDKTDDCCDGFLPQDGTQLPNPNGKIPTSRNLGQPGYNLFTRDQWSLGYELDHKFNDILSFHQNLKYFWYRDDTQEIYGAGLEADQQTEDRYNFVYPETIKEFAVDSRVEAHLANGDVSQDAILGLDYRNYTNFTQDGFAFGPPINIFHPDYNVGPIAVPTLFTYIDNHELQTGLYGQDLIKWDNWVLTLSARNDWVNEHNTTAAAGSNTSEFTWRAGLNYVMANGFAPYISYATTFEATPGTFFNGDAFKPRTGWQSEGGIKYQPNWGSDAHALFTAAVYDLVQDNVLTPDPDPTHFFASVQTGQVEVKGLELEAVGRLWERFSFNASYSYTDSKVTKGTADVGTELYETPKNKFSLFGDYTQQTGPLAGLGAGVGLRYVGTSFGDQANQFENASVTLWDAIIHYDRDNWRLALNANNLFDKVYVARCSSSVACWYGERRTVALTLSRKW